MPCLPIEMFLVDRPLSSKNEVLLDDICKNGMRRWWELRRDYTGQPWVGYRVHASINLGEVRLPQKMTDTLVMWLSMKGCIK